MKRRGEAKSGRDKARSIHQERESGTSFVAPLLSLASCHISSFLKVHLFGYSYSCSNMDSLPDATLFQLVSSSALQGLLDKIIGPKTLVLSPSLAGPLGLVTEVGLLKVRALFCSSLNG